MLGARHSALGEAVVGWLRRFEGWEARPEVSFSWYGERGVIDVLAWHAQSRTQLQIEIKTEIVDVGELLGTLDRRRRLGDKIGEPLGWAPSAVATLVVIAESETNRRRVRAHEQLFVAGLPDRIVTVRRYLRHPGGDLRGLIFFSESRPGNVSVRFASPRRIRPAQSAETHDKRAGGDDFEPESPVSVLR
jgi:hypothetical protein